MRRGGGGGGSSSSTSACSTRMDPVLRAGPSGWAAATARRRGCWLPGLKPHAPAMLPTPCMGDGRLLLGSPMLPMQPALAEEAAHARGGSRPAAAAALQAAAGAPSAPCGGAGCLHLQTAPSRCPRAAGTSPALPSSRASLSLPACARCGPPAWLDAGWALHGPRQPPPPPRAPRAALSGAAAWAHSTRRSPAPVDGALNTRPQSSLSRGRGRRAALPLGRCCA